MENTLLKEDFHNNRKFKLEGEGYNILLKGNEVYSTKKVEFHETSGSLIWLINPSGRKFNLSKLDRADNITLGTWEIPLTWSALIYDKVKGNYRALSSVHGEVPWFYSPERPGIISTNLVELAKAVNLNRPDEVSIASYLSLTWITGGYSFVEGIRKATGGSILKLENNTVQIVEVDLKKWLAFDGSIDNPKLLVDKITEITDNYLNTDHARVTLTAGKDSRGIAAAANLTGKKYFTETGISPSVDPRDIRIAKKISDILGVEHIIADARKVPVPSEEEVFSNYAAEFNGEAAHLNALIHYKEIASGPQGITKLFGWGGDIYWGVSSQTFQKLNLKYIGFSSETTEVVKQRMQPQIDYLKNTSERDAVELFHLREKIHYWITSNFRTFIPHLNAAPPYMHPELIALGFRFKGGIANSRLLQNLYLTMPEAVQKIPRNGGKLNIYWNKIRRRIFPRTNYSMIASPGHVNRIINPAFFKNIIAEDKINSMLSNYQKQRGADAATLHRMMGVQYLFDRINK